jgi:hypothetical protein
MRAMIVGACLFAAGAVAGGELPRLVESRPAHWATDVDPARDVVTLRFNLAMRSDTHALLGRSSLLPGRVGEPSLGSDAKSFSVPVKLESGRSYVFALNERGLPGVGFQSVGGDAAAPGFLVFRTRGEGPEDQLPPKIRELVCGLALLGSRTVEVTVKFDRAMSSRSHGLSVVQGGAVIPVDSARATYAAKDRAWHFVFEAGPGPIDLVLNSDDNIGFRSESGVPLWPVRARVEAAEVHPARE